MAIVTQEMLERKIGASEVLRLTDDSGAGAVEAGNLQRAIADGESEIAVRVGQRYAWPPAMTDATTRTAVTNYCLACVVYKLYDRRGEAEAVEGRGLAYKAAIAWADKIAEGKQTLPGEVEAGVEESAAGGFMVDADERVVSRDNVSGL